MGLAQVKNLLYLTNNSKDDTFKTIKDTKLFQIYKKKYEFLKILDQGKNFILINSLKRKNKKFKTIKYIWT